MQSVFCILHFKNFTFYKVYYYSLVCYNISVISLVYKLSEFFLRNALPLFKLKEYVNGKKIISCRIFKKPALRYGGKL